MNSYDQTSMKYPDSSKSTKNKDDLHDEATTAEASRLLSTDQTRK